MKLAPFELFRKELTIKTSYVNPLTRGRSVALLNAGMIELDRLCGGDHSAGEAGSGSSGTSQAGKVIVRP